MSFRKQTVLLVLALWASLIWYAVFNASGRMLEVSVLNVGQGDSTFIRTKTGNQVLIDGGPGRAVLSELSRHMPAYDKSIDVLIATHTDLDHLGGLVEVLKSYSVGEVIENGLPADTQVYQAWEKLISEKHIPRYVARVGDRMMLDAGTTLDILGPWPEDFTPIPQKANEAMIVSRLTEGANSFLFMGDLERSDELRLTRSGLKIASDVLKVAHHGSRFTSSELFLERADPSYAAISVGAKNSYGHPTQETLDRLAHTNAKLFRTDQDGTVTFLSDGNALTLARTKQ